MPEMHHNLKFLSVIIMTPKTQEEASLLICMEWLLQSNVVEKLGTLDKTGIKISLFLPQLGH